VNTYLEPFYAFGGIILLTLIAVLAIEAGSAMGRRRREREKLEARVAELERARVLHHAAMLKILNVCELIVRGPE
jgi:hypothetical protein